MQCSLKYVPKGPINNIPALVQIMAKFTDAYMRHRPQKDNTKPVICTRKAHAIIFVDM